MEEDYKVYAVEPIGGVGLPVIITSVSTSNRRKWLAEYFLLIPDSNCSLFPQRITCDSRGVPEDILTIDSAFMLNEALNQSKMRMFEYLYQRELAAGRQPYISHPGVMLDNRSLIISYWMREPCRDQLRNVKDQTECGELREFLEIVCHMTNFGN